MKQKMESTQALKDAIACDIETLKTLELDIMPAKDYYHANRQLFIRVFFKLYGTVLIALLLSCVFYWTYLADESLYELVKGMGILALMGLGLCVVAFIFIYSSLNNYVLINYQLRSKLKTGDLLVEKIRWAGRIAYRIFAGIVLVGSLLLGAAFVLPLVIGGFFISSFLTSVIVEMEVKRIGLSTLFTLVKSYFDPEETAADIIQKK